MAIKIVTIKCLYIVTVQVSNYAYFVKHDNIMLRLKGNYTAQEKGDMGKRTDNRAPNP